MQYDVIVLGSGPAGFYFAKTAAGYGKKVLLIEKDLMGGTGFRTGCLPVKNYLDGLRRARSVQEADCQDWCQATVDHGKLYQTLNRRLSSVEGLMTAQLKALGVEIIYGEPYVKSGRQVEVDQRIYSASNLVIATGTMTNEILGVAIDEKHILSHKGLVALQTLPSSMVIIGGNVEGIECASYLSGFGVKVTILAMGKELLEGTDRDLCEGTLSYIESNGGCAILNAKVTRIDDMDTDLVVTTESGERFEAEKLLITGARSGNIPKGLDFLNVALENTCLKVNDCYETSLEGVYAIGDVNGLHGMAHIALQQGIQLADYLYAGRQPERHYESLPRAIFTINEIAGAGLQEGDCIERKLPYTVKEMPLEATFRGWSSEVTSGKMKLILGDDGLVLGAWMASERASDFMGTVGLWIDRSVTLEDIKASLFIHPSMGEGLLDASIK
ncbi:MAG: NAD(P)/FAD-dependent oxidoreductase [Clostridia bacterium]|nr:NAD(P)/FAD-dependent oxidoreductase [Clostridia bacterium]